MKRRNKIFLVLPIFLLILASCGAKKKVSHTPSSQTKTSSPQIDKKVSKTKGNLVNYYADLLGTSNKFLNEDLYYFIDDWMGIPHRLGGQTRDGIDCSAFVNSIYQSVYRKNLPRTSRDMAEIVKRKYDDQLQEGDLVFFSFGGKNIDHVGVYLHNGKFVHVSTKQGVVISNLKDPWYYKYFTRCGTPNI